MKTPICDFVRRYADSGAVRFHMPGHKGIGDIENADITEISGADSLYEADGIIAESEENASSLFGCDTCFGAEGSSQCIKAMLYLAVRKAVAEGKKPLVFAGRNAHKAFVSAAALIDFEIEWIYGTDNDSYLTCNIDICELEAKIKERRPSAVYLTSPDYLGNVADIEKIAKACKKYDVMLLVDNAHGAYLRFLPNKAHPMDLGATMCCDSAHKTLPVLTGGAYIHTDGSFDKKQVKDAMVLFGSTSPSYLIMQSLDRANAYIEDGYRSKLENYCKYTEELKDRLSAAGFELTGSEPLKICIRPKGYGYYGGELADVLFSKGISCEFSDPDNVVFMLTPEMSRTETERLTEELTSLPRRPAIKEEAPLVLPSERAMSVRSAVFSPCEEIPVKECEGRVLGALNVGCPPAVPIVVCGEIIDANAVKCFEYYGIKSCTVIKK